MFGAMWTVTPAMAAGVAEVVMDWADIVEAMDMDSPKSGPRGPYKKSAVNAGDEAQKF